MDKVPPKLIQNHDNNELFLDFLSFSLFFFFLLSPPSLTLGGFFYEVAIAFI